jgi:hypothetical protein
VRISTVLPAEKATAEAALAQAQVIWTRLYPRRWRRAREQFLPALATWSLADRAAGVLIPEGAGRGLQVIFGQIRVR